MTTNASTLLAPVTQAFPKYAGVLDALATLMSNDAAGTTPAGPRPTRPGQPQYHHRYHRPGGRAGRRRHRLHV